MRRERGGRRGGERERERGREGDRQTDRGRNIDGAETARGAKKKDVIEERERGKE